MLRVYLLLGVFIAGVCGGDGQSCLGCDGTPNSGLRFDSCRVCGGDNRCENASFCGAIYHYF